MKFKINQQTTLIIKKNLFYIIAIATFMVIGLFFIPKQIASIKEQSQRIDNLNQTIQSKTKQLAEIELYPNEDPIIKIGIVDKFFPKSEDYFSIFNSIDILNQKSGIIIDSYTSPYGKSRNGVVSVTFSGIGTYNSLMYLLSKYHFISGRLITISSIKYTPMINSFSITIQFYTSDKFDKASSESNVELISLFLRISQEYPNFGLASMNNKIDLNYAIKSNPFIK